MRWEPRRLYGFFLSINHIVTLIFWKAFDLDFGLLDKLNRLSGNNWSFLPSGYADFIQSLAPTFYVSYVALAFLTPILFLIPQISFRYALGVFAAALFLKLSIYFSSYDFMGNYQYMANLVMAGFLLTAGRLFVLQVMLVLFYFGAGLIKLNWEWISGAALIRDTFLTGPLLIAACVYVVVLELVLVWGVFSRRLWLRNLTLAQLFLFHIFSWHIVGFYYPVVMILMLTVFLIEEPRPRRLPWPAYLYVVVFLGAQFYPKVLNKNESVTAEGRTISLNMLDAKAVCLGSFELKTADGFLYLDEPIKKAIRVRCDPLVFFNYGKHFCQSLPENQRSFVSLNLRSRKTTDKKMTWTIRNLNICDEAVTYSIWRNAWVYANNEDVATLPEFKNDPSQTRHWRENPARTGESTATISLKGATQHHPMRLNSGIHLAAKSSPIGNQERWFVGGDDGFLWGFAGDKKIWSTYFPESHYGFHGSAAVASDGSVIIGTYDGILHRIDGKTGRRLWGVKLGMAIGASPLILENEVIIAVEDLHNESRFYNLDLITGEIRWQVSAPGLAHASPAYHEKTQTLYFATNAGKVIAIKRADGQKIWEQELPGRIIPSPVVTGQSVVALTTDGTFAAFDLNDGHEIWKHKLPIGGRATPTYSSKHDLLIVGLEHGEIVAFATKDGSKKWSHIEAHPHASSGLITLSSDGKNVYWDLCAEKTLCALNVVTGEVLKKFTLPASFTSTPAAVNNVLVITLPEGFGFWTLGAFKAPSE